MLSLKVPAELLSYLDDALSRLHYLHPETHPERCGDTVDIASASPEIVNAFERDLYYALCRAKIHAEGHEQRHKLFELAFGK